MKCRTKVRSKIAWKKTSRLYSDELLVQLNSLIACQVVCQTACLLAKENPLLCEILASSTKMSMKAHGAEMKERRHLSKTLKRNQVSNVPQKNSFGESVPSLEGEHTRLHEEAVFTVTITRCSVSRAETITT